MEHLHDSIWMVKRKYLFSSFCKSHPDGTLYKGVITVEKFLYGYVFSDQSQITSREPNKKKDNFIVIDSLTEIKYGMINVYELQFRKRLSIVTFNNLLNTFEIRKPYVNKIIVVVIRPFFFFFLPSLS